MRMMMRFGCAAVLMAGTMTMVTSAQTSAPVKDDLFSGTEMFAKGASDVTEITMDPDTLGMVSGKDGKRAHGMVLNVVRTYEYDKPGMYRIEDVDAFRNKLNSGEWHCSVHTRDLKSGESTDICNKRRTDDLSETAIITVEPKQLTFIHTIRKKGEGESELGELPMMMGFSGGASLAMLDPMAFADMTQAKIQMSLHGAGLSADMLTPLGSYSFKGADLDRLMDQVNREMDKEKGEWQRRAKPAPAPAPDVAPVPTPALPAPSSAPQGDSPQL